ncbi:MAG: NAD-dependent epimerase/dehydratase family protein [Woeseiaceae bacterium]|nr:NAD-dependent epimerase/dehydratase family protein [Woeseiaceae bacterium]
MKAFVTGATGFAGGSLCRHLVRAGHDVVGLARKTSDRRELEELGIKVVFGDIRESEGLASAMLGCDVVFHLAAAFRETSLADADYQAINVDGTANVVRAAAEAGVDRFVHCSTIGVVGDTGSVPADESRPYVATDEPYNRTKIEGEEVARQLFDELGMDGVIVRPTAGYGPGEMRYLKLFKNVAKRRFVIFGSGETLYNLSYIDDLCSGLLLCATHPDAVGETFNLGGAENVTLNAFVNEVEKAVGAPSGSVKHVPLWPILGAARVVEAICKPFGVEPPLHRRRVGFFTVNRAANIEKARKLLGYDPQTSMDEGTRITADWYRDQGLL